MNVDTSRNDLPIKQAQQKRQPSMPLRLASGLVKFYLRHMPLERGKWWLREKVSSWLITKLDTGPWIRVSGVAGFLEWGALLGHSSKENLTVSAFRELLRPDLVFIDVGANVGYFSLTAAASMEGNGFVIAFEPEPLAAERLRENISLNGYTNIRVVQKGVGARSGSFSLHLSEDTEGASMYKGLPAASDRVVEVSVVSLDDCISESRIARVDLLKIDAEGSEVEIIRGARKLLSSVDAPAVIIEANPIALNAAGESTSTMRAALESLGYSVSVIEKIPWQGVIVENWMAKKSALSSR